MRDKGHAGESGIASGDEGCGCGVRTVEALRCSADAVLSHKHADQPRGERRRGVLRTSGASPARAVLAALIWFVHSVIASFLDIRCMFADFRNQVWEGNLPARSANQVLKDGLWTRLPHPDFAIAVHDTSDLPAGKVSYTPGYALANVSSVDVTIFGRGGHGAVPQETVDPIVIAARTILAGRRSFPARTVHLIPA